MARSSRAQGYQGCSLFKRTRNPRLVNDLLIFKYGPSIRFSPRTHVAHTHLWPDSSPPPPACHFRSSGKRGVWPPGRLRLQLPPCGVPAGRKHARADPRNCRRAGIRLTAPQSSPALHTPRRKSSQQAPLSSPARPLLRACPAHSSPRELPKPSGSACSLPSHYIWKTPRSLPIPRLQQPSWPSRFNPSPPSLSGQLQPVSKLTLRPPSGTQTVLTPTGPGADDCRQPDLVPTKGLPSEEGGICDPDARQAL